MDPCPACEGLFIAGWSEEACLSYGGWDPDADGVNNGCENALAAAFAPQLIMMHDCNWDYGLNRMGGEYLGYRTTG